MKKNQNNYLIIAFVILFASCVKNENQHFSDMKHENTIKDVSIFFETKKQLSKYVDNYLASPQEHKYSVLVVELRDSEVLSDWNGSISIGFCGDFNNDIAFVTIDSQHQIPRLLSSNSLENYSPICRYEFPIEISSFSLSINAQSEINLPCDSSHYAYEVKLFSDTLLIRNVKRIVNEI